MFIKNIINLMEKITKFKKIITRKTKKDIFYIIILYYYIIIYTGKVFYIFIKKLIF